MTAVILLAALLPAAPAASQEASTARVSEQFMVRQAITQALAGRGAAASAAGADLDFSGLVPLPAGAQLRVESGTWDRLRQRGEFRLRCAHNECLPFLVLGAPGRAALWRGLTNARWHAAPAPDPAAAPILVRAGDRAPLRFEDGPLRLTLPVVVLRSARAGELVQVRSRHGAQWLLALVQSDGSLQAVREKK
jgi:hypothetical protein